MLLQVYKIKHLIMRLQAFVKRTGYYKELTEFEHGALIAC